MRRTRYVGMNLTAQHAQSRPHCTLDIAPVVLQEILNGAPLLFVYPDMNFGDYHGFDIAGASELSFYIKGNGTVEFYLKSCNLYNINSAIYLMTSAKKIVFKPDKPMGYIIIFYRW